MSSHTATPARKPQPPEGASSHSARRLDLDQIKSTREAPGVPWEGRPLYPQECHGRGAPKHGLDALDAAYVRCVRRWTVSKSVP